MYFTAVERLKRLRWLLFLLAPSVFADVGPDDVVFVPQPKSVLDLSFSGDAGLGHEMGMLQAAAVTGLLPRGVVGWCVTKTNANKSRLFLDWCSQVIFTDDMAVDPVGVLKDVLDFLGLEFTSDDESKVSVCDCCFVVDACLGA